MFLVGFFCDIPHLTTSDNKLDVHCRRRSVGHLGKKRPQRPQRPQRPKRSHYQRSLSASSLRSLWSLRSATSVCPFRRFVVCQFVCLSKSPQLRMVPWSLGPEVLKKNAANRVDSSIFIFYTRDPIVQRSAKGEP